MKISWVSNAPWARTGYGNQTMIFCPRLVNAGHEVAITAFYGLEGGILNWNGIPVYPRAYHPYGNDVMAAHAMQFKADIMLTLIDAWVYEPNAWPPSVRWVPWFPIDHDPIPKLVLNKVARSWARIVYSRFAEQQIKAFGMDCYYVPHGVNTEDFSPMDRKEAREILKWPEDKFIVGMVAANKGNPSRKAFVENIGAFGRLKDKHADVMLYLHTVPGEENAGMNIAEYVGAMGLTYGFMGRDDPSKVDVIFNDQYAALVGLSELYMKTVYNTMDVHTLVTTGEGFGLPLVEAQACGCPVITSDWTANSELCFSGWKVARENSTPFWTPLASWQFIPRTEAILELMEKAYHKKDNEEIRRRAREGALAYDADRVMEQYWKPALDDIHERISGEDAPVKLVRFNERAAV